METPRQGKSLNAQCQDVIGKLDRATNLPARAVAQEVGQIQGDVVRLRDNFIEEIRRAERLPVSGQLQTGLDGVNVALTLVVGVEYPVTAIKRSLLEQARDILKKTLDDSCLI